MRIGLFSNGERRNQVAQISCEENLHEGIVADDLGIQEAWISEHETFVGYQSPDQLPCADPFICKAAALTKETRMGPGIRPFPYSHPLQVATDTAVCDHLTNGRYMAGFGVGRRARSIWKPARKHAQSWSSSSAAAVHGIREERTRTNRRVRQERS
jgi:alkanesulfonate monooxygenase SsuD/methylene tetrahydromethanopterin reductase-like flavin-dependent oxidoreductase (luciferase family)